MQIRKDRTNVLRKAKFPILFISGHDDFLIPLEQRKEETEDKIKKRLRDYFRRHYEEIRKEVDSVRGNPSFSKSGKR
jgi:homoserine acetyltransferase